MPDLGLLKLFLRELFRARSLSRSLQPLSDISVEAQIDAMGHGGSAEGRTAAGYLFHSAQICSTIQGCETIVDLGCGTGVQLIQVAQINPQTQFIGVDRSPAMLDAAVCYAEANSIENVSFLADDLTDLRSIRSASVDGVISTMSLHHLPGTSELSSCFSEISRILRPAGAIYIEDFGRLKCEGSVDYFVSRDALGKRDSFSQLYEASMRAAFLAEELRTYAGSMLPTRTRVFSTFPIPFLVVLKTPGADLTASQKRALAEHLDTLGAPQRRDYQELALAFRLGGLAAETPVHE